MRRNSLPATVADGDAKCPFTDCGRVIEGVEIKRQAQAGEMGEQLYAVVFKRRSETKTKSGKPGRAKWIRAPRAVDDNRRAVQEKLNEKLPEWEALGIVPTENLPMDTESWTHGNTPAQYGAKRFQDLFNARQLFCHGTAVEVFHEILRTYESEHNLSDITRAAFIYLSLSLDKLRDYNSRLTRWITQREVMANTFDSHDFGFKWSYVEMAPQVEGLGFDWAIEQIYKCIRELLTLVDRDEKFSLLTHSFPPAPLITVT
jgi:putative DNA methylase